MRKILVVVDMQNDFIDGSLGTKEAQAIVPRVVEKIREYDPWNIYLTRDTHYENYLDTQEGRNLPVIHCVEGTDGWQVREEIAEAAGKATYVDKPSFGSSKLAGHFNSGCALATAPVAHKAGRPLHRYLRGVQRAAAQGGNAGSAHHGRRLLLCRRHAGAPQDRAGDDEVLPDPDH